MEQDPKMKGKKKGGRRAAETSWAAAKSSGDPGMTSRQLLGKLK